MKRHMLWAHTSCAIAIAVFISAGSLFAQTTAGTSATIVMPVIAQTTSFSSEITAYNPNAGAISVDVAFYDANNTASPGLKTCTPLALPAGRSAQFVVATQCALPVGSNFGLLILSETTGTQRFYGYARTQTSQGAGFSTEGFPIENFNDQLQHATGLKRTAASGGLPAFQSNCFVATLGDAVNYELRLFNGGTGAQLGGTLSGTLGAFQQFRYLDVFAVAGVAAGDKTNVRAQFTNLTAANKKLIGFCTVQDNTALSADFRIAKSFGGTPQNAFVQGGNAFGTTALLGTVDTQPLELHVANARVLRIEPPGEVTVPSPNIIGGSPANNVAAGVSGATIAGGGMSGSTCGPSATSSCANSVGAIFGTVGGGFNNTAGGDSTVAGGFSNIASGGKSTIAGGSFNTASGDFSTVAGGDGNTASGSSSTAGGFANTASGGGSTVAGGSQNTASGLSSTVTGGFANTASGDTSFAAGANASADQNSCAVFGLWSTATLFDCLGHSNIFRVGADHGFSVDYFSQRVDGGGTRWVAIGDTSAGDTINTWNGAHLTDAGVWVNASSSKARKTDFAPVDVRTVLEQVAALPITTWRYKEGEGAVRHMGPMAEDFWSAFHVGYGDHTIADLDARGVALAAIQGLNAKVKEQQLEIAELRDRVSSAESLRGELAAVKAALIEIRRSREITAAR